MSFPRGDNYSVNDQSGMPMVLPSSGTIGNNGALSGLTALPNAYAACYMYFPANAIAAGIAAGMYYVVMSSTTAGTIYNNLYVSGEAAVPVSPTPFVTTGPGAYTQTTGAPIALLTSTVSGRKMGIDGQMFIYPLWSHTNNANSKIESIKFGGVTIASWTQGATATATYCIRISNRMNYAKQVIAASGFGTSAAAFAYTSIDTSVDCNMVRYGQLAVATDYIVLESSCCMIAAQD